ncbi:unnamed protein product [Prorocentrum cordatum]|uniref:Uncharacterized protein n=1 Tax=Prorocentrum cordatum TaxID=2364126 RepID=A0ABN9P6R9_9DINO|nr:unnamed protein product [Polarella glacialis]
MLSSSCALSKALWGAVLRRAGGPRPCSGARVGETVAVCAAAGPRAGPQQQPGYGLPPAAVAAVRVEQRFEPLREPAAAAARAALVRRVWGGPPGSAASSAAWRAVAPAPALWA